MIQITLNGQPFTPKTLEDALIQTVADSVRTKLGSIRHPETGEFPTVAIVGSSLTELHARVEGSEELLKLVRERLANDGSEPGSTQEFKAGLSSALGEPRVFLSYAFEDKELARRIAEALQSNGIDTWWDNWCINAGDSIRQRIDEGLADCTHFVVLLTSHSVGKPWVRQEMDAGLVRKLNTGSKFIAVRSGLLVRELPPLLQGMLSPSIDEEKFDISQLINDIHGISVKPPLGQRPTPISLGRSIETGNSAAATALAKLFVEATAYARQFDPQISIDEAAIKLNLSREDVIDAAHELTGLVTRLHGDTLFPEEELFVRFDKFWKAWDPSADALQVATGMVNGETFPGTPADIAKHFGWEPRRLNPALAFLAKRGLVRDLRTMGNEPWLIATMHKTDETRRFVKSRQ